MAFLMLAQGDPIGKDLLKKLVDARFGSSPPGMDTLRVTFKGRSRARIGPLPLWARVNAVATYEFPRKMKWEFKVRVLGLLRSSYTTSFDGEAVYEVDRLKVKKLTDEMNVRSAWQRAWSETVFFISPLIADHEVRVESVGSRGFRVLAPGSPDIAAHVRLNDDNRIGDIEIERVDPADGQSKVQRIRPLGELKHIDGLNLPETIQRFWDNEMFMELSPVKVELNPQLEASEFTLESEDLLSVLDEETEHTEA